MAEWTTRDPLAGLPCVDGTGQKGVIERVFRGGLVELLVLVTRPDGVRGHALYYLDEVLWDGKSTPVPVIE